MGSNKVRRQGGEDRQMRCVGTAEAVLIRMPNLPKLGETTGHCQEPTVEMVLIRLAEVSIMTGPRKWSAPSTVDWIFNENTWALTLAFYTSCLLPPCWGKPAILMTDPQVSPEQQASDIFAVNSDTWPSVTPSRVSFF